MIIITHRNNPSALSLHRPARNYPLLIVKSILVVKKKHGLNLIQLPLGVRGPWLVAVRTGRANGSGWTLVYRCWRVPARQLLPMATVKVVLNIQS